VAGLKAGDRRMGTAAGEASRRYVRYPLQQIPQQRLYGEIARLLGPVRPGTGTRRRHVALTAPIEVLRPLPVPSSISPRQHRDPSGGSVGVCLLVCSQGPLGFIGEGTVNGTPRLNRFPSSTAALDPSEQSGAAASPFAQAPHSRRAKEEARGLQRSIDESLPPQDGRGKPTVFDRSIRTQEAGSDSRTPRHLRRCGC